MKALLDLEFIPDCIGNLILSRKFQIAFLIFVATLLYGGGGWYLHARQRAAEAPRSAGK